MATEKAYRLLYRFAPYRLLRPCNEKLVIALDAPKCFQQDIQPLIGSGPTQCCDNGYTRLETPSAFRLIRVRNTGQGFENGVLHHCDFATAARTRESRQRIGMDNGKIKNLMNPFHA